MKIMKNILFTITLLVSTQAFAMEAPLAPPSQEQPNFAERFISLPHDLQRELLLINAQDNQGTYTYRLAKGIFALAGTNKALRTAINKPEMIIGIMKKIRGRDHDTRAIIYFAHNIALLPARNHPAVITWIASREKSLYFACYSDLPGMVAPLLAGGANPNIILEDECPPLMLAAVRGNANVVRLLLEHGANPTLRYKGRTACDLATQAHWGAQQYDETIELLNEATNKREKRKNESDENSTQKKQKTELK